MAITLSAAAAAVSARGGDNVHAGVTVLTNSTLWSAITDCMSGYPLVVRNVCTHASARALLDFDDRWEIQSLLADNTLVERGVLVHLAIAAGSLEALTIQHSLRTRFASYRLSAELAFDQAMRCAVLFSRVDILQWLTALKASDPDYWTWEPDLLALAMRNAKDTSVHVLEWIAVHAPQETLVLLPVHMHLCARNGRLDLVQWLHDHGCPITQKALHDAAESGHVDVLQYLYHHTDLWCTGVGVNNAARNGHLDVIKLIVATQDTETTAMGLKFAAQYGHVAIVQFLIESKKIQLDTSCVIDFAAESGNLALVEYLHALYPDSGCTTQAMDSAAAFGHLEIVQFLHEHRSEGCSSRALDLPIRYGRLAIIEFLYERYPHLEVPPTVFNCAVASDHFDVVMFLHEHFPGAYTPQALHEAIRIGRLNVVEFLHAHSPLATLPSEAFDVAAANGHIDVVKFLHERYSEGCTSIGLHFAAQHGHLEVVRFLCEHRSDSDVPMALSAADAYRRHEVAAYLRSRLPGSV